MHGKDTSRSSGSDKAGGRHGVLQRQAMRRIRRSGTEGEYELVSKLLNMVSLKGEDIMIQAPSEETLRYHRLRASLPSALWKWKTVMGWPWKGSPEHINVLECSLLSAGAL